MRCVWIVLNVYVATMEIKVAVPDGDINEQKLDLVLRVNCCQVWWFHELPGPVHPLQ